MVIAEAVLVCALRKWLEAVVFLVLCYVLHKLVADRVFWHGKQQVWEEHGVVVMVVAQRRSSRGPKALDGSVFWISWVHIVADFASNLPFS